MYTDIRDDVPGNAEENFANLFIEVTSYEGMLKLVMSPPRPFRRYNFHIRAQSELGD